MNRHVSLLALLLAFVIAPSLFADPGFGDERLGRGIPERLRRIGIERFECKDASPLAAFTLLVEKIEEVIPDFGDQVKIESAANPELIKSRNKRYVLVTAKMEKTNAWEVFQTLMDLSLWHFKLNDESITIYDFPRGQLEAD